MQVMLKSKPKSEQKSIGKKTDEGYRMSGISY